MGTTAIADDRDDTSFSEAETEIVSVNDYLKDSFLDGNIKRLESQNKVPSLEKIYYNCPKNFHHQFFYSQYCKVEYEIQF